MKYLALAVLLCALASVANARCDPSHVKPGITHCQDNIDETWHVVGSSWRNSLCMDCNCGGCCPLFSTPVGFPEDCVVGLDLKACNYVVHKRNDPTVPCPNYGSGGK